MRRIVLAVTAATLAIGMIAGPASARTAPAGSIVDIALAAAAAEPAEFTTLVAAVVHADPAVLARLGRTGQLTLFAPTDAAFAKLGLNAGNVASLGSEALTKILLYHVAHGGRDAADVVSSTRIRTLEGGFLTVTANSTGAYVNSSKIIATDIPATNGIIHVIDTVLLP